ncbi:MAG: arylsulfatase [Chitinophagaceae bacterium]|nr:arylsulfatase [Chitinophagaceae bacterium]MCW5925651.1 arylsulfatase [Chitinophagaceae bacterium]
MKKFNRYTGYMLFLTLLSFFSCNQTAEQKKNTGEEISNLPKPTEPVTGATVTSFYQDSKPGAVPGIKARDGAPNVVIFIIDDMGFGAMSTFGGPVASPNLDRVAKNGLSYIDFHTTAQCSPTRAALLAGRNHHSVSMGTIVDIGTGFNGYTGQVPNTTAPIATVLKNSGYATSAWGKWHQTAIWENNPFGPFTTWPTGQGFDKFYGFIGGETNQYFPALTDGITSIEAPNTPGYNLNDDLADHAIAWLRLKHSMSPEKPFFLYFAPGATHAPHQVSKEWSDKYKGKFDEGYDVLRQQIYEHQIKEGKIPSKAGLSPRPEEIPAFSTLSPEEKKVASRLMEVYAGFAEQTDYEAGRLLDALQEMGELDNTIFMYIVGDNGASSEGQEKGMFNELVSLDGQKEDFNTILKNIDKIGGPEAFNHYNTGWAWALDAPFQWVKLVASHYGGTSNPLVVSWPAGIKSKGEIRTQFHHVIDIAPTIYEAAGIQFPEYVDGVKQKPLEGVSMVYSFDNKDVPTQHTVQYFELFGNRGIYDNGWYACAKHGDKPWNLSATKPFDNDRWELYNMKEDFSQANDLAGSNPEKLKELQAVFDREARKYNVYPMDDRGGARFNPNNLPLASTGKTEFTYYSGAERIPEKSAPRFIGANYNVTVQLADLKGSENGAIVAIGGVSGGWSIYMKNGTPYYVFNEYGEQRNLIKGTVPLKGNATLELNVKENGPGKPADAELLANGKLVGKVSTKRTPLSGYSLDETFDVGNDLGSPVGDYKPYFKFNGNIKEVKVKLIK